MVIFLIICGMENIKLYLQNRKMEKQHKNFIKEFNKKLKNDAIKNYWNNKKSLSYLIINNESTYIAKKAINNDLKTIKFYNVK